ncbi:multidrug effflux MFS transporter [Roseibium sp. SCP14]|uniref:multidrug effflux MFS transporter n=1 Tax=Roseibium sp. SCP14 TaxID=3141375 RepID=UPI0033389C51
MISNPRTPPHLLTIILLTAFSPLSLNMFLPSLENIARDLKTDYALVSVAIAGYLAVTAVIQLIAGPLSDRFGRRPVLLVALTIFCISSIVCSLAQNIWVFLTFRMLQGSVTAGFTLSLAIVRDTNPPREAAGLIGYITMSMAIAPMLGPVLGGILDSTFGWRTSFYFYAFFGIVLLLLCWFDLGETRKGHGDGEQEERDNFTALLRERRFFAYAICTAFSTGAFYIFLAGAPLAATATFGVTTVQLGFLIGSITMGFSAGGFLAGRFAATVSLPTMMLIGRIVACSGLTFGLLLLISGWLSPWVFFGSTLFVGIGNGLTMPSSNSGAMSVRPDLAGSAAGLVGASTLAGGAILTSLTGAAVVEDSSPEIVIALMLASSLIGLIAATGALIFERNGSIATH